MAERINTRVVDNKLTLSKWGEVSFSVKTKHPSHRHNLYPITKPTPTNKLRWLNLGGIDPIEVPIEYELSHHVRNPDITLATYWSNKPALMYFGNVPADKYVGEVDIPEVRAVSRPANPYYMDEGLVMFDISYNGHEVNLQDKLNEAIRQVLKEQGIETFNKGAKLFYKDSDGNDVKISSPETAEGHTWTYLNIDTDYLKAYDYYTAEKKINDPFAYGLKKNYPDISKEVVDLIVQRFAELSAKVVTQDNYTPQELKEIERLKEFHANSTWVREGERDDPGWSYFNEEGHEYEVILDSKPTTNIVPLEVETDNLIFYYQPKDLRENVRRPDNVEGSFAAYHADELKHHTSEKYQTGKVFHLYRPWAKDATGRKVWCSFGSNWNGTTDLEVTIPQDFLDTATYPIVIDPTMGYTTAGGSHTYIQNANSYQALVTIAGFSGSPAVIAWYGDVSTLATVKLVAAIYTVAAVRTDYSIENSFTASTVTGWNYYPTTQSSTLSNAVNYDIGIEGSVATGSYNGYDIYFDTATNAGGSTTSNTYSSPPPATQPTLTTNNNKYSFYVDTVTHTTTSTSSTSTSSTSSSTSLSTSTSTSISTSSTSSSTSISTSSTSSSISTSSTSSSISTSSTSSSTSTSLSTSTSTSLSTSSTSSSISTSSTSSSISTSSTSSSISTSSTSSSTSQSTSISTSTSTSVSSTSSSISTSSTSSSISTSSTSSSISTSSTSSSTSQSTSTSISSTSSSTSTSQSTSTSVSSTSSSTSQSTSTSISTSSTSSSTSTSQSTSTSISSTSSSTSQSTSTSSTSSSISTSSTSSSISTSSTSSSTSNSTSTSVSSTSSSTSTSQSTSTSSTSTSASTSFSTSSTSSSTSTSVSFTTSTSSTSSSSSISTSSTSTSTSTTLPPDVRVKAVMMQPILRN